MTEPQIIQKLESGASIASLVSEFPSIDAAYLFLVNYAQKRFPSNGPATNHKLIIEWRIVYYNWSTGLKTMMMLPLILIGHVHESHMQLKFTTYHSWPESKSRNILMRSRIFEIVRFINFGFLIVFFIGLVLVGVPLVGFLTGPEKISVYHWLAFGGIIGAIVGLFRVRAYTYVASLPQEVRFLAYSRSQPLKINGKKV